MIDRCSRCSAAAKEVWELETDDPFFPLRLFFCGHHANDHRSALRQKGWVNTEVVK